MFGGLHFEMGALRLLGNLLEDSGWTGALTQAGIASSGTADSFLKASHVTRTRRAHQITVSSLYLLRNKAYNQYAETLENETQKVTLEEWCSEQAKKCPQFQFWSIILQLELYVLIFVRSIREANFQLYVQALAKIIPWFFALDHTHYARWTPIHLHDMISLEQSHPSVYAEFVKGKFVVKKSKRLFSAIAIDQAHEQNNALVKGDGGAVGLTENSAALHRWMVSGPEMARLIGEFQTSAEKKQNTETCHHEQKQHIQSAFARDVRSLTEVFEEMGNPFLEDSEDLLVLDSRNIADVAVSDAMKEIEELGLDQYEAYVEERLVKQTKTIADPIKRNNLHLFSRPPVHRKSSKQLQLSSLKNDCSLFSRLYIASQTRNGDLDDFFSHENQVRPPVLSKMGIVRDGNKSELLHCLEELVPLEESLPSPRVEVLILDGAAIVNMLKPVNSKTFQDYANKVFLPYIQSQLQHVSRLDLVWDVYLPESLKADTRSKRGKGIRRRVEASSAVPQNWRGFLRIDENKTELFSFLSTQVSGIDTNKQVIATCITEVLCNNHQDIAGLAPCTHEEADTRILLHLEDAVRQQYNKVSIRTVDTDVVVLAITSAQRLGITELWVAFGAGKNFRLLPIHELANALGPQRCIALPFFHALTGCDTVSFFGGKSKRTSWNTWKLYDLVTPAFCALAATPSAQCIEQWLSLLERFVVLLYDRTSSLEHVNEARKELFTKKGRTIDRLPPTQAALIQHIKRAAYQAGHCWAQVMIAAPELPSPGDWGWKRKDQGHGWEVFWTTLPEATQACRELIRCGCKKECRGRCKCQKAALQCTALCNCGGHCND